MDSFSDLVPRCRSAAVFAAILGGDPAGRREGQLKKMYERSGVTYGELAGCIVVSDVREVDRVLWRRNVDLSRSAEDAIDEAGETALLLVQT